MGSRTDYIPFQTAKKTLWILWWRSCC